MARIIAIDPGYDRAGIAIFDGDTLLHSECATSTSKVFSERIGEIARAVRSLVATHNPTEAAMETLFFSKNVKTALSVAEARGALTFVLSELHIPLFEYSPQAVKIAVTGSGSADKEQVTRMVDLLVPLSEKKRVDDEYDAIAIGICHHAHTR